MSLTSDELQAVIRSSAFDNWMELTVQALDADTLTMHLPFRPEIVGTPKVNRLHGGVVGSLIDAAAGYLIISKLNKRVSTVNLVIDYLRPGHGEMRAVARLVKLGRKICNVAVEVTGSDGKLCATGRVTLLPSDVTVGEEDRVERIG